MASPPSLSPGPASTAAAPQGPASSAPSQSSKGWFAAPAPIRSLFKLFPLHVYPPNDLPLSSAPDRSSPVPSLYVFAHDGDAHDGTPSFNPSCLKWQTLLRIAGVDVRLVPSSNHASPSGSLPFLSLPGHREPTLLAGAKIGEYARRHAQRVIANPDDAGRLDAYEALMSQNIRPAWLHALYLLPANEPLLTRLYLRTPAVLHAPLKASLVSAATEQILTTTRRPHVDAALLRTNLEEAFAALSELLGEAEWFAGEGPGVFDAEVFAYTHLIGELEWEDHRLRDVLAGFGNLVRHERRVFERCWGTGERV